MPRTAQPSSRASSATTAEQRSISRVPLQNEEFRGRGAALMLRAFGSGSSRWSWTEPERPDTSVARASAPRTRAPPTVALDPDALA
jgi:hypothetical protein